MKKSLCFCGLCLLGIQFSSMAQDDFDIEKILEAGQKDLNTYMNQYAEPAAKGFMYSMGTGWAHTAQPHKTLGFDIKFGISAAAVPSGYETFTFSPADYTNIRVRGETGDTELPTLFGPASNATLEIYEDDMLIGEVEAPPGVDIPYNYVPAPSIQVAFGLPAGTEIIGRFIPKVQIDDAKISQWGLGIKHDIKQHIPVISELPFSFSALAAYNSLKASYHIDRDAGQHSEMDFSAWTFQALVSKKLSLFTFYGSVGYNTGESNFGVLGDYEVQSPGGTETITDPVDLNYSIQGALASLGARIKLGPIFIFGDYTFQEFNTINAGLGVSIR